MNAPSENRCDSFVLCCCAQSTTGIYVVEEKGAHLSVTGVKKQLQSGADFISSQLNKNDRFDFLPVLVAKGVHKSMLHRLRQVEINLSGKKRRPEHVNTNAPLEPIEIVSNARTKK